MNEAFPAVSISPESIEDQADCVFRELELAIEWQRPSILFALYNSNSMRITAQDALERRILESGKAVIHFQNNDAENTSLGQFITNIPHNDETIFFIDSVTGDCWKNSADYLYKNLNTSRDQLIDHLIRVVFWLTESEAFNLARNAPDFWASRHRVIDFIAQEACDNSCMVEPTVDLNKHEQVEQSINGINILLSLGVTNWKKGDPDKAVEFLQAALAIAGKTSDAARQAICWKAIALVKSDSGKTEDALRAYNQVIALVPENITVWNNVGALYQKTRHFEKAYLAFSNAIKQNGQDPISWNGLGTVYASTGRSAEAVECFKKAIQFNASFVNPWINLGDVYASLDQNDQALKAYMRAMAMDAKNADVWSGVGNVTFKINYHRQAINAYTKAIEYGASPDGLYANLAAAYSHIGDNVRAVPLFQKAIEFSTTASQKSVLWKQLGDAYRSLGDRNNATSAYQMSERLATGRAAITPNQPRVAIQTPEAKPVEKISKPAPAKSEVVQPAKPETVQPASPKAPSRVASPALPVPESARLWVQLGNTYARIGALEKALNAFQKAASLDIRDAQLFTRIAVLYEQKNDPAQAIAFHQKSLDLLTSDKERTNSLSHLAGLHRQMKDFDSALQSIEAAANLDPQNETILIELEKIQADLDASLPVVQAEKTIQAEASKPAAALIEVPAEMDADLINVDLDNANVWNELGNIFAKSNSYQDAIDAYNRAIEIDPEFGWSYSNLAQVYSIQGQYDQALKLYHRSIELLFSDDDKAITWNRLGDVYRRNRQYPESMQAYQNADKLSSDNFTSNSDIREVDFDQPFAHFVG